MRSSTLILVSLFACSKPADEAKPETKPIETPVVPKVEARPTKKNQVTSTDVTNLIGQLKYESEHRPKAGVTAEQVFDALEPVGFKLEARTQYMGKSMHASFCAGGKTADHVHVSMCEYPDDKSAQDSADYMNKTFTQVEVKRVAHRAAVLSILDPTANDPRVEKAVQAFMAL